jgi:4-hydroxy-2-oxoheptanedioate aldolase
MSTGDALRQIWSKGGTALGMACMMPSAFGAEILANLGIDFLMIDCQHGLIGYDTMVPILQAVARTAAVPLVRVPPNDAARIGSALDAGAAGVVVPMVSSRTDAEQAVAASHYPPAGERSMGPVRSELFMRGSTDEVNRQVLTVVMLETVGGVESAEAICSCPGIDAVMVGFVDLALSLGVPLGVESKELDNAISVILEACRKHRVVPMIGASTGEKAAARVAEGYRMLLLGSDYRVLRSGAASLLKGAHSAISQN